MINKDKAETILAEIKQQIESSNKSNMSFSAQTILWMAESLVAAVDEVEKLKVKAAAVKEITAEKERAVAEKERVKEEYFKLLQNFRKAETAEIAKESKGKLLKKWRSEPK